MRKLIIIILFSFSALAQGQQLNFRQVDTATYNQYLRGDWQNLIRTGKQALDNNIDYYYLQMRMAYACFSLERYREAGIYYKNALNFNSKDPIANEYLYYSYKYSGRSNDALLRTNNLSGAQKSAMEIRDSLKIVSFGISYTSGNSNAAEIQDAIFAGSTTLDGVQKASYTLRSPHLSLAHRFGTRVILNHDISYIAKDEISYTIVNNTEYLSPTQPLTQLEYALNTEITLMEGLSFKPGIHFITATIPLYDETSYGFNAGRDRTALAVAKVSNRALIAQVEKRMTYFDLGLSYVNHNFNLLSSNQLGLHTAIYPFSNLNLYINVDAYLQILKTGTESASYAIIKPRVGMKLHKNFWLEVSGTAPEHFNFYDVRNGIAYNSIEKTVSSFEGLGILPLYKSGIKLFLGYQYRTMNSYYFPADDMLNPLNKQSYNSHLITGGIKWTL